jgi:hypothetical protein
MDFFVDHAFAVAGLLLGILALHLTEYIFRKKPRLSVTLASCNLGLHIILTAYFLLNGAGMEELLLVLLLSLSVGLVRKEV